MSVKLKVIFFFGLFLCFSVKTPPVYAQSASPSEGLTISPPIFEITLKPQESAKYTIRVTNPTKNLIELYPSSMDFASSGEGGQPTFLPANETSNRFSMANWITFETSKIALLPEQVVEFNFQISVPEDAEPGGHYGVVFLATEPPKTEGSTSHISLSSKVGSLLLVKIPGDINEKGSVEEFSTPWFYFSPPVNITAFIRNSGNIHFRPDGEITIKDWKGKDLERISINPLKGNVLPDSRRKFEIKWDSEKEPFWKIPIGRFSANLRLAYGQSEQTLDSKVYFWIIPWWIIITTGIFFLVVVMLIFFKRRKRKNNRPKKKSDQPRQMPPTSYIPNSQKIINDQTSPYQQSGTPDEYPRKEIPENYLAPQIPRNIPTENENEKEKKVMRF